MRTSVDNIAKQYYPGRPFLSRRRVRLELIDQPSKQIEPSVDVTNGVEPLARYSGRWKWPSFEEGGQTGRGTVHKCTPTSSQRFLKPLILWTRRAPTQ
jgi:hypothetical protein